MKRTTRKMSESTKFKISTKMKGKSKSTKHKEAIAKSMIEYWKTIPEENGNSSIQE